MNKLKRYIIFLIGLFVNFHWLISLIIQRLISVHPYFFYSICTEPEFSVDPR